jgi:hypothetical protein
MDARKEKILLSAARYGGVTIVRRSDGLFCLYRHWRGLPEMECTPLPGIYATIEDAERDGMLVLERERGHEFAGMTVNERLYAAGLMDAFGTAARARDRDRVIGILSEVAIENASATADAILADPARFDY